MSDSAVSQDTANVDFSSLGLPASLLSVINEIGYEVPSPIQVESIPVLMSGVDLIGQAQTGTGKTAAFALPILSQIDVDNKSPQALVLAPTRELAIQVAEAFNTYSRKMKGFKVVAIYGGQSMSVQIKAIKRGAQVIVGTPGRIMDHMRRGKLNWDNLKTLVLDEADEMLRMGFIEDVEWILEQTPDTRQIALFSATMPNAIRRVADKFLSQPQEIKIKAKTATATTITQQFLPVTHHHKVDALTRILEVENTDGIVVFVRTRNDTTELADKLNARGYAASAINGDMQQSAREQTIEKLKNGKLDILVATDVAARGIDVQRVSHVINYDIPQDPESYVHRIGRTGRAGREGCAILFVTPREKRMLYMIEKVTGKKITRIGLPSTATINDQRIEKFKLKITEKLDSGELSPYLDILNDYQYESSASGIEIAAALASLAHEQTPLLLEDLPSPREERKRVREDGASYGRSRKSKRPTAGRESRDGRDMSRQAQPLEDYPDMEMQRFVLMAGYEDGVKPANVVGAIANEVDIESKYIGHIKIYDDFTSVDLPGSMPKATMSHLKKVRVCGKPMNLTPADKFELDKLRKPKSESSRKPKTKSDRKPKWDSSKKPRNKKRS